MHPLVIFAIGGIAALITNAAMDKKPEPEPQKPRKKKKPKKVAKPVPISDNPPVPTPEPKPNEQDNPSDPATVDIDGAASDGVSASD